MKKIILPFAFCVIFLTSLTLQAGLSPKFRIYFNRPVNTAVSSGTNAISVGSHTIDTLINYINLAQSTLDITQYDYIQDNTFSNIATAVNNAYNRGVIVRWIYDGSSSNSGLSGLNSGIHTLASPTGSAYNIMHDKFVIVDANASDSTKTWVYTGSMDWSSEQVDSDYNNTIIIQSQQLAKAYTAQFNQMWGGTGAAPTTANEKFGPFKTDLGPHIFTIDGIEVELYFSPTDSTNDHIIDAINSANSQLYFGVYTFTEASDATAINAKFNAGVSTFGIVDQYSNGYPAVTAMSPVLGNNLKIYAQSNSIYHNKYMIADACDVASDPLVLTGSHNWSSSADTKNDENTLIVHDATIANIYYQAFNKDFTSLGGTITGCTITTNCDNAISTTVQTNSDVLCYGGATGKATVHASGSGPFNYTWSSSPTQTDSVLNNVAQGTYTVTITDNNSCSATTSVTIAQPNQLVASATATEIKCYGQSNGSDTATATGGTGAYSYKWSNYQTTPSISGLSQGNYSVTITDANHCTATATSTISEPTQLSAAGIPVSATCYGGNNGSDTASANGGTGNYTYQWSNTETSSTISNLTAGVYTLTVKDGNDCSATATSTVGQGVKIVLSPTVGNVTCLNGDNGSVAVSASGGAGSFHYAWNTSPQQTTSTASDLASGDYTVTVTDGNNYYATATYQVTQPATGITLSTSNNPAPCGDSTGSASVTVTSGGGSYGYSWSTGARTSSISNLPAGGYTVTVTSTGGCTATAIAIVNGTGGPGISATSSGTTCGKNNGSAGVTINSGTGPFTYAWSGDSISASISNLAPGTYFVTVTNASHCPAIASATINSSTGPLLSVSSTNATCGSNNGSASVTVSDTSTPYNYSWSNNGSASTISDVYAGSYIVTVTDHGGCSVSMSVYVDSSGSTYTVAITANQTTICSGDSTELCATAGFTNYNWSTGATSSCIHVIQTDAYTVTASNSGNCSATATPVQVTVSSPPQISFTLNNDTLTATGASTYQWYLNGQIINGADSDVYVAAESGNYSVDGTTSGSCNGSSSAQYIAIEGIAALTAEDIIIYPNPSSLGYWQLQVPSEWIGAQYKLVDDNGKLLAKSEVKASSTFISTELPQGIYFITITSGERTIVRKLIKL